MSVQTYTRQDCPVAHTLSVVGDQWTLLIIRDVLGGPKRFDELQNGLGISLFSLVTLFDIASFFSVSLLTAAISFDLRFCAS